MAGDGDDFDALGGDDAFTGIADARILAAVACSSGEGLVPSR
jgi:hypothetical protein